MLNNGQIITLQQGQYKILGSLGGGGQGSIWTVESLSDGQHYALKTVHRYNPHHPELEEALSPENMARLIRYAQLEIDVLIDLKDAASHYILPCLDHGTLEKDDYQLPTFVMPLYKQGELTRRIYQIHDKRHAEVTLTFRLFLKWFQQLMLAVDHLHQSVDHQRLIHRDISPRNCLLSDDDDLYLIDFGLTRESSQRTFSLAHAEDYCAPEQYLAQAIEDDNRSSYYLTPAIDLYSAALVMHQLLTNADTRAQFTSGSEKDRLKNKHNSFLYRQHSALNKPHKGKIGMLGKVGGLTHDEIRIVTDKLLALLCPKPKTMAFDTPSLPNYAAIVNDFVQLMQQMLAPWPDDRPRPKNVLQTLDQIDAALAPQVSHFRLVTSQQTEITVGTQAVLTLEIAGKGLPEHFYWLQLIINEAPVLAADVVFKRVGSHVTMTLASFEEIGHYRIRLSALVNNQLIHDEVVIEAKPTAEQLWYSGQREAALLWELNEAWLDEWEAGAKTTRDKYQLSLALERLQQHYPSNTALAARFKRVEGIVDDEPEPKPVPFPLKTILTTFLVIGAGSGGYYWFKPPSDEAERPVEVVNPPIDNPIVATPEKKEQKAIAKPVPPSLKLHALEKELSTGNKTKQQKAWQRLQQLIMDQAQHPDIKKAQKLQQSYEETTIQWIQSKNKKQQKTAFIRLQILADNDNKAQHWLGIAYWRGLGTTVDYKQAWLTLRTAIKQGNNRAKQSLNNLEADITAKLQANDKKERLTAYPALEAMAKAGEPNAQWLLATLYLKGKDRPQDMKKGKAWAEKAAKQGVKPAIETLKKSDF